MTDRLRELLDRPIGEGERRRLFALVALAVLGVCLVLLVAGRPGGDRRSTPPTLAPAPTAPPVSAPPAPTPPELEPRAPEVPAAVTARARRFLDGYLAYLYGHGPARVISDASAQLRRGLEHDRPRVSPATRKRRGRVAELTVGRASGGRYAATATIDDGGVARYPIALTLRARGRRLVVVEVGGE